jgi:hypothetical protein
MGAFKSSVTAGPTDWYTFSSGTIGVDSATGAAKEIDEGGTRAPWAVAMLAIEQGMGALQSTANSANNSLTYKFASGSITTDAKGKVAGATGGSNRDQEIQNMGAMFGFGAFKQVGVTSDTPPQRRYDFASGSIWTDPTTGAVNGVQPAGASSGFDGNVAGVAYLRGFGAFKSVAATSTGFTYTFQYGTVVQTKNSDGSFTVTGATRTS